MSEQSFDARVKALKEKYGKKAEEITEVKSVPHPQSPINNAEEMKKKILDIPRPLADDEG